MKSINIKLSTIEEIHKFVDIVTKYPVNLDLKSGRYTVNAHSFMGIVSLDLMKPVEFIIDSDDDAVINAVLADVKTWTV